jgi:altronate dehydratase
MDGISRTHEIDEKCIQNFNQKYLEVLIDVKSPNVDGILVLELGCESADLM